MSAGITGVFSSQEQRAIRIWTHMLSVMSLAFILIK